MPLEPLKVDVLVIGAGIAGVAAAISAARAGASTCLVERSDILGGNATQAFVHSFCGLYLPGQDFSYANPGFSRRLAQWLIAQGGAWPPEIVGKVGVLATKPTQMTGLLLQACAPLARLQVSLQTSLIEAKPLDDSGFTCILKTTDGPLRLETKFIIDASGDANAAAALGAEMDTPSPEEIQHSTFIFRVSGANPGDLNGYQRLKLTAAINRGSRSGQLPNGCDSVLVRPAGDNPGDAFVSLNLPKSKQENYDPLDEAFLQKTQASAQEWAQMLVDFLRAHIPGWQACEVLEWPRRLGIRETRRVRGRYIMTAEDILQKRTFEDTVAISTWPIELWHSHTGATFQYPTGPSEIPLRALISVTFPRLGMAGRCMSGTHEALGALRVLGTAMATGEAIGLATALATVKNVTLNEVRADEVRSLRDSIDQSAGDQP